MGAALVLAGPVDSLGAARAIGMVAIGAGMATLIMYTIASSSSVASAFHGGGAGAGAGARGGAGTATRTATTVTATPMAMATVMVMAATAAPTATAMAMVNMGVAMVKTGMAMVNMATPASPELPNYSGGCNALVIITDPLTESSGRRREPLSGSTNRTTAT